MKRCRGECMPKSKLKTVKHKIKMCDFSFWDGQYILYIYYIFYTCSEILASFSDACFLFLLRGTEGIIVSALACETNCIVFFLKGY